ncbi:hypothetical protein F5B18DRAFT_650225 [Nemania serpens]|nr:hypothetical protein F5B18DRAFT_650225 [Nemania serpens]
MNLKPFEKHNSQVIRCRDLCSATSLATMSQIPTFKIHPPKAMTGQRCQCQCQNPPTGKLVVCKDGTVGSLDPELVLCDVCFFELKEIIIKYDCGCKPYVAIKPCAKPDCEEVERVNEPPCALCVKEELEREQQRSHTK